MRFKIFITSFIENIMEILQRAVWATFYGALAELATTQSFDKNTLYIAFVSGYPEG